MHQLLELRGVQRLRAVRERVRRIRVNLDEESVRAGCEACHGDRRDETRDSDRMRRIDDYRKVRHVFEQRYHRNIEHVAGSDVEGAYPALAENDALVPG